MSEASPSFSSQPNHGGSPFLFLGSRWMLLSLLTILMWGAWGVESKIIVDRISPWLNQVLFSIGLMPPLAWILCSKKLRQSPRPSISSTGYGTLTGILGGVGNIAFYLALSKGGKVSMVIPVIGLAPLVTVILALVILKESLNRMQGIGLVLALISIYLLSL
jgi:transporter family protein